MFVCVKEWVVCVCVCVCERVVRVYVRVRSVKEWVVCVEEVGSMWVMESEEVSNACVEMVVCFMWRDNVQLWYVACVEGGGGYTSFQANINQPIVVIRTPHVKVGGHFANIPLGSSETHL